MDGQNFNNDNFNNENFDTNPNFDNFQSSGNVEQNAAPTNNYYQDNTQYQQPVYTQPVVEEKKGANAMSIVGLVLGILSIVITCCYGLGIIFAIPGLILGIIGNKKSKSGVGLAAIICSVIGLLFNIVSLVIYGVGIAAVLSDPSAMSEIYGM